MDASPPARASPHRPAAQHASSALCMPRLIPSPSGQKGSCSASPTDSTSIGFSSGVGAAASSAPFTAVTTSHAFFIELRSEKSKMSTDRWKPSVTSRSRGHAAGRGAVTWLPLWPT